MRASSLGPRLAPSISPRPLPIRHSPLVARSAADEEAELEKRLERLRTAKGATPYGKSAAEKPKAEVKGKKEKPVYDFTGETVYYEGPPHKGDLALNVALGTTLVWLPLTFAAIGRAMYMTYKFTDKRMSITSNAPWKIEQTDVAYQEIKEVITIGRGVGLWGDMVVTLKDGSKVEMRSLDRFVELKEYILKRRDELVPKTGMVTADELMGTTASPTKKGFA